MIVDINGNKYTSAQEDIDLQVMQRTLRDSLEHALRDSFTTGTVDCSEVVKIFEVAYSLGRVREGCKRKPSGTEWDRYTSIVSEVIATIMDETDRSAATAHDGRMQLDLDQINEHLVQAYYAGREDGAA